MFVLSVFIGAQGLAGSFAFLSAVDAIKANQQVNIGTSVEFDSRLAWTLWVPVAKFFGNTMDVCFTVLALPVSRVMIMYAYNASTDTKTCGATVFRLFLKLVPLDQALLFHQLCAWVGFYAAILHTLAHVLNYGQKSVGVWLKFDFRIWLTGSLLIAIMALLFSATHKNVKQGHFEIFWATHMLFPFFWLSCLFHADQPGKTTNFPFWFALPGSIFLFERMYRVYKAQSVVKLLSVTHMQSNVVAIAVDKSGPLKEYCEGQYAFLMCPAISNFQWHPFTISSAPQATLLQLLATTY